MQVFEILINRNINMINQAIPPKRSFYKSRETVYQHQVICDLPQNPSQPHALTVSEWFDIAGVVLQLVRPHLTVRSQLSKIDFLLRIVVTKSSFIFTMFKIWHLKW